MASIMELKGSIDDLKREEKALMLKLKAVRGRIAAAQLDLMAARQAEQASAPAERQRARSRSRSSHAHASSDSSNSSDEKDDREDAADGGDAAVVAAAPPPGPLDLALVLHQGGRAAGRARARGRGRTQHPKRPAGRCRACWYRELGVAGGSAHTGGEGCDRGAV